MSEADAKDKLIVSFPANANLGPAVTRAQDFNTSDWDVSKP